MIQLTNLQRLCRRSDKGLQTGFDQDIYRVLAIAQTLKTKLYTAADVIRLGWNSTDQTEAYKNEYKVLYGWANKKDITGTSHHRDAAGNFLKPAKWTGNGWQSEVAHKLWNQATEIINVALALREANENEGRTDLYYWYDVGFGSFAVTQEKQALVIAIANKKHASEKAEKKGVPADESWKHELQLLLYPEKEDEDKSAQTKRILTLQWIPKLVIVLVISLFLFWLRSPLQTDAIVPETSEPKVLKSNPWAANTQEWQAIQTTFIPTKVPILDKAILVNPKNLPQPEWSSRKPALYAATGSHPYYLVTPYETLKSH